MQLTYLHKQSMAVLGVLTISAIILYILWSVLHTKSLLQKEVGNKTQALKEAHESLQSIINKMETVYAFQQSIIDGIAEPIMVINADYQVKMMNRAAQEFAVQKGITDPVYCYQVSHLCTAPCNIERQYPCPMEIVRESGKPVTVVHEHTTTDGKLRFVEVIASPLWNTNGEFQGIIEATRDITDRMTQVEDALAEQAQLSLRSEDELGQFTYKIVKSFQDFLVDPSAKQSDDET